MVTAAHFGKSESSFHPFILPARSEPITRARNDCGARGQSSCASPPPSLRCSRRKTPAALLLAGCSPMGEPCSGYRPASHAFRRSAPCLAGLRQMYFVICLVSAAAAIGLDARPRKTFAAARPVFRRFLPSALRGREPSAAARLRRGGLRPPCATASLGAGLTSATNAARSAGPSLRRPQPSANAARAACGLRG